jgi:hypothetical protein
LRIADDLERRMDALENKNAPLQRPALSLVREAAPAGKPAKR